MYRIYKITSHPTVDFAAEELKKYLRMMMPEVLFKLGCGKGYHGVEGKNTYFHFFLLKADISSRCP